jgi:hypothetical protein
MDESLTNLPKAFATIDGNPVDLGVISVAAPGIASCECRIELSIRAATLLHELTQAEVDVTPDTLRDFLAGDSKTEKGRGAYLGIAQAVLAPRAKSSFFLGLFRRPSPSYGSSRPKWFWTETVSVEVRNGMAVFCGKACSQ